MQKVSKILFVFLGLWFQQGYGQTVQELISVCNTSAPMGNKERGFFMSAQAHERSQFYADWDRKKPRGQFALQNWFNERSDAKKALEARQGAEWERAIISCNLKQDMETFHKGFDAQIEPLRKKLEDVQKKLSTLSDIDKAYGLRQFTPAEWKSMMDALSIGYRKKGHETIDSFMFKINVHEYEKLDANWKSTVAFITNASNVQKFIDYLVSLRNIPETQQAQRFGLSNASIKLIQDVFNEKSSEATGNECEGLEFLFGSDYSKLTIAEQAYVDQLNCKASGYFGGYR